MREDNNNRFSLHPVVAEIMKAELKPTYANCADFLERMMDYIFDAWRRPFSENDVVKGCVLATLVKMCKGICQFYLAKEMNGQALDNLETSLNINLKYRGDSQIDTIENREWLGDLNASLGDDKKAGDNYQKA